MEWETSSIYKLFQIGVEVFKHKIKLVFTMDDLKQLDDARVVHFFEETHLS